MSYSLEDYDNAMVSMYSAVFPNVHYAFAEWAFKEDAKPNGGIPSLPMVSMYRTGYTYNQGMFNFAEKFYGRPMWQNQTTGENTNARSISVSITYQLDIWGNTRAEMDGLTAETILFFEFSPILLLSPENIVPPQPFRFDIVFEDGPIDNTDIMSFETHGRIYRNTIFYTIPEARLIATQTYLNVQNYSISYNTPDGSGGVVLG